MAIWRTIRENGFVGYNDRLPSEYLPKGYLADVLNAFVNDGTIEKRTGYSLIGNDLGAYPCQGLKGVTFANGTKELIGIYNGLIYKWTGSGDWAALSGTYTLKTTGLIDIVIANDNVYFFDGTNEVPKYNGTTMSTVATIPIGNYARWFHNQLHVAGISGDLNALKSSDIGDPETFTGGNSSDLDINPNDGDYITGLHELKDELFVFKRNRVWAMTGFGSAALTIDDLNERLTGFGTLSHWGIVNTGNDLLYIGFLGNKPIIRSIQRTKYGTLYDAGIISNDIEATMEGLNKSQLTKVVGMFDGLYAWFAVPNSSSTYNNLVLTYNTVSKGWMRHTGINAAMFELHTASSTPQMYFGEASADSKAYVMDTSTDDNGTAINFQIVSRRYGGEAPETQKKYKYLYLTTNETGDYDITVDYALDGFSYDNLGTLNLSGTGSIFDAITLDSSRLGETDINRARFEIPKSRDYYWQFKAYDDSATSSVQIRNWELLFHYKQPVEAD